MRVKILACGLTTVDATYQVAATPGPNQKVVASEVHFDVGGPAANAARTARALGAEVTLVTALGHSPLRALVVERLAGITLVDVGPASHQLPISTVLLDSQGSRSVVSVNASRLTPAPPLPNLPQLLQVDALLLDGHLMDLSYQLAAGARSARVPTVFDGGSHKPGTEALLRDVDVAAVSADFTFPDLASDGVADTLGELLRLGARAALQTHGAAPITLAQGLASGPERWEIPVPKVPVVDTLGAGDVFHGALTVAIARGLALTTAVEFARDVAARSVQAPGALGWAET